MYTYVYGFVEWGESKRNGERNERKEITLLYICRICLEPFGVHYLYAGHLSTIS